MAQPECQTCHKPIKFELLKDEKGQAIPKPGELTKDGKQKYKYKPVNPDGSKHECAAAVFTATEEKPAAAAPATNTGTFPPTRDEAFMETIALALEDLALKIRKGKI